MTILQKPRQSGDRHAARAGIGSAMAIKPCVTPRRGSTKTLLKNKRDGSEAILSTPVICERGPTSEEEGRGSFTAR